MTGKSPNQPSQFVDTNIMRSSQSSKRRTPSSSSSSANDDTHNTNNNNNNNNNNNGSNSNIIIPNNNSTIVPESTIGSVFVVYLIPSIVRLMLIATVSLYVLNQNHLLPIPISRIVSRTLFWPTLPLTYLKRHGSNWYTSIDDTVVMGGAPFGFMKLPELLYEQYNVRGVINLCEEYRGPDRSYQRLGIRQLHLPTIDHCEPSMTSIRMAMRFIHHHQQRKESVYIHCRAGHGRSAAIAFAWLLLQQQQQQNKNKAVDLHQLNQELCAKRNVRSTLYQQPNILKFHSILLQNGNNYYNTKGGDDDEFEFDYDDDDDCVNDSDDHQNNYNRNDSGGDEEMSDDDDDDESRPLCSFNNIEDEL